MFRKGWQHTMIALARSDRATRFMQGQRATSRLSRKFVAGESPEAGLRRAQDLLARENLRSSLFYLGEYVEDHDGVRENRDNKLAIADALAGSGLDLHISVDPTQIGLQLDLDLMRRNAVEIARRIKDGIDGVEGVHGLMLDMEDASVTDTTIALHDALQDDGLPTALTLQAYLRRTEADLARQIARGSRVRLVKGAFAASADIAFPTRAEIKANSRRLIELMLSPEAKARGFYPVIATHDTRLHAHARAVAATHGWAPGSYEFEMLFGVRGDVAKQLAAEGERVRLYLPFGRDWWPYAVRRIGENPRNAVLLARSLVQRDGLVGRPDQGRASAASFRSPR